MRAVLHLSLLLTPLALNAFSPRPGFDLIRCVGSSELIVAGRLGKDATFTVSEVLAGKMPEKGLLKLDNAQWISKYLAEPLKLESDPEIILFLEEPSPQRLYRIDSTRLVTMDTSGSLWAFLDSEISMAGNSLQQMQGITKPEMLGFIRQKLTTAQALKAIIEQPASKLKTEKLIRFLHENFPVIVRRYGPDDMRWLNGSMGYQNFYVEQAAKALHGMSQDDVDLLLKEVEQSKDDAERAMFLCLANWSFCPSALFERVKPWVDPGRGTMTRSQAFAAVLRCDYERGIECLIPLLRTGEPQLREVLGVLPGGWPQPTHWPKSLLVPLHDLGVQLLKTHKESGSDETGNRGYTILHKLDFFSHPHLVPVVLEWAESKVNTQAQALGTLVNMLGFVQQKDSLTKVSEWVAANKTALDAPYDLVSRPDEWFQAYRGGDTHLRPILLRCWDFEDRVDETALMRQAAEGKFAEEAKAVLAYLWEKKRLSRSVQREIVQTFISFSLEKRMLDSKPAAPALYLVETKTFPFPHSAWVGTTSDVSVDRPVIESFSDNAFGSSSLEGAKVTSSWLFNVVEPDKHKVHVAIVYREENIELELGKRWRVRWDLEWPVKK